MPLPPAAVALKVIYFSSYIVNSLVLLPTEILEVKESYTVTSTGSVADSFPTESLTYTINLFFPDDVNLHTYEIASL